MDEGMACRGIRGAVTVDGDGPEPIRESTAELLDALAAANGFRLDEIAAAIFTVSDDLHGANPAAAARAQGWDRVPLLVVREHGGDDTVPRCLRVLLLWNTPRRQSEVQHIYLRGAAALRPDLQAEAGRPAWSS